MVRQRHPPATDNPPWAGITSAEAISKGRVLSEVLDEIKGVINECDYIVGHNIIFDINVLNAEFYRYNMTLPVSLKPYYCTMQLAKGYCGLSNTKYPTLEELYTILKGDTISNAHNAQTDAQASMECFWILRDSGFVDCKTEKSTIKIYPTEDNISWAAEHISKEYATKVYAYLVIACNLLCNKSNFLKSKGDYDTFSDLYLDSFCVNVDDKDFTCTKSPQNNSEWINSMFNFLNTEIQKTGTFVALNKFDGKKFVVVRPYLRQYLKQIENEFGGKELIDKFKLKYPDSPYASLILEDESCWVDIAVEAVKARTLPTNSMGNKLLSQTDAEVHFISMIEFFNEIRERERNKRIDEWHKELEKSLDPKALKESEELIKNYSSPYTTSSSGCILILSLLIGIGSSLCCLIAVLLL